MITIGKSEDGCTEYHEGDYWIEIRKDGYCAALYHTCPDDPLSNVLLESEVLDRECCVCGPIDVPDELWALFVMLDGRGVR
jgi:hypothetical protein